MNRYNIAIIGVGQIGSRHLQALALLSCPVSIYLVDPSEASLATAVERFGQVKGLVKPENVHTLLDIEQLPGSIDIAIIASSAQIRRALVDTLLSAKQVRYLILEKFLFQKPEDFDHIGDLIAGKNIPTWVNCPRRVVAFYKKLKQDIGPSQRVAFSVAGSQIGIGCNGIHYLDLMSFLTGELNFTLSPDGLDAGIKESKRPGFIEFTGSLQGFSANGSSFHLTSFAGGSTPTLLTIASEVFTCVIREGEGKAWFSEHKNNWQWEERACSIPFQSQITHLLVEEILQTGTSQLTTYEDSKLLHLSILKALTAHAQSLPSISGDQLCPIT